MSTRKGPGKPDCYESRVLPRLAEIEKLAETMTDFEIATAIGIGKTSLARYKSLHAELKEAIERGRAKKLTKYEKLILPRLDEIREWKKSRATDLVIAKKLGISYSAFKEYKYKHREELGEALQLGKDEIVFEISEALIKAAKGYYIEEPGPDGEMVQKWIKPDVAAAIAILKSDDPSWHNDDHETRALKKWLAKIAQQKADDAKWG